MTPGPGFTLEANSPSKACAEVQCCGSCVPPPLLSSLPPAPTVAEPGYTNVELCQDGEDIGLTTSKGGMEEMGGQDSDLEMYRQDNRVSFQIFPDPVEVVLGPESSVYRLDYGHEKELLPSIVVEPTELNEVESGELRWPPEAMDLEDDDEEEEEEEEEELFLEQCIPPANIADWGDEDDEEEEKVAPSGILNHQTPTSLTDLQSDAFRDDSPTLPPSSAPALN